MRRERTTIVLFWALVACGPQTGGRAESEVDSSSTAPLPEVAAVLSTVSSPTTTAAPASSSSAPSEGLAPPSTPPPTVRSSSQPPSTPIEPEPREVRLTIPLGTAQRIDAGEDVGDVLPSSLDIRVGDRLVIVNNDSAFHIYGPLSARGGETVRYEFLAPGDFSGFCTINSVRRVTISVRPANSS